MMQPTTNTTGWEDLREVIEQDSTREQIAALAYALWQERGSPDGSPRRRLVQRRTASQNALTLNGLPCEMGHATQK